MLFFLKGNTLRLVFKLFLISPIYCMLSMLFKLLFLLFQIVSLGMIIQWANGNVNPLLLSTFSFNESSLFYPMLAAVLFVFSSFFSLYSKKIALLAISKLEHEIVNQSFNKKHEIKIGDLKNITKVLIHFVDVVMPAVLITAVAFYWVYKVPIMFLFFLFLFFLIFILMKKGVRFSSIKYKKSNKRMSLGEYLKSKDHENYFNILMLSNYLTAIVFPVIVSLMIISICAVNYYSYELGNMSNKLTVLTVVAIFQTKGFVGLSLKLGSCYNSLIRVYAVLFDEDKLERNIVNAESRLEYDDIDDID